jgi:nicotinate-nucleotide--dimethylbenzimidazole phosphoribosyltransferase
MLAGLLATDSIMRVFDIAVPDPHLASALQDKINNKTKPHGALGRLERLALQIGLIQHTLSPELRGPAMLVFAGDHGIVESGVSPYPQAVTAQMVLNFLAGGAGINVFARLAGMKMRVIDAGVNHIFEPHDDLIDAKVGMGTRNFLTEPAMTQTQCEQAFARGAEIATAEMAAGANVLGFGEMGIGNTSSAAALMSVLCELNPAYCVGRGTGLDAAGLQRKQALIEQALQLHKLNSKNLVTAVEAFGGFEIAMMAGAMLGAAEKKAVLIIDGFIASAALLVASKIAPAILHYCVFAHCSDEAGHRLLLEHMQAEPLLNLGLRLGEGTGAALAYPLLQAAVGFLNDMASFDTAGVSRKTA